jgi:antirestriction protein ArdC
MVRKKRTAKKQKRDIYQEVTDQILGYLEEGTAPWRNPIAQGNGDGWPKNLHSGNRYRGINVLLLSMKSWAKGYPSDYWMTFKQAQSQGGSVRKGEQGTLVTFWKMYETRDRETNDPKSVPVLRHYMAFNLQQIDGVEAPDLQSDKESVPTFEPLDAAESIVAGFQDPPDIQFDGGHRAFYRVVDDSVHLPEPDKFDCRENFYCTLFHELSHSTGIEKRLNRGLDTDPAPFGSPDYSREELVAELSASFLCASCRISPATIEQSASYLQGWIKVLKGDKRLIVSAAGTAQKSADLILGESFQSAAKNDREATVQSLNPQELER